MTLIYTWVHTYIFRAGHNNLAGFHPEFIVWGGSGRGTLCRIFLIVEDSLLKE